MAKAKKGGGSNDKAPPKCTCDDPYQCSCGNRPPRPSKGHKWDPSTQQWGGKGHKQKGASTQAASVGQQATTTAVGKTQIAQWQKLPSDLLLDFCQKQKRPLPKFKEVLNTSGTFKYRCIVPDGKDSEKDLFFVPAHPVENEEQAKEEAALLALLQLTPNLPHERKLPEPYKSTWMHALKAAKQGAKPKMSNSLTTPSTSNYNTTTDDHKPTSLSTTFNNKNGAAANTKLVLGSSFLSAADKRKQEEQQRQERNAKIRKHEAIRMANRPPQVFLSAKLRLQIQQFLKGNAEVDIEDDEDDESKVQLEPPTSERQQYVEERLQTEGFTRRQVRMAYENHSDKTLVSDSEDLWERLYDDCLQWLCIHLDEDQLPEGFDPRGQTLEILKATTATTMNDPNRNKLDAMHDSARNSATIPSLEAQKLADAFGLSIKDAQFLLETSRTSGLTVVDTLWKSCCQLANVILPGSSSFSPNQQSNLQIFEEEVEALESMFGSDCQVVAEGDGKSMVRIATPEHWTLQIYLEDGLYPECLPNRVLIRGGTWSSPVGLVMHVKLIQFLSTLSLGEPMIFELYGQMQLLLQTADELCPIYLLGDDSELSKPGSSVTVMKDRTDASRKEKKDASSRDSSMRSAPSITTKIRRPRERGLFWSTPPEKSPPVVAFPEISASLENQRKSLPAGKARGEFLSILKEAAKV